MPVYAPILAILALAIILAVAISLIYIIVKLLKK